MVRVIQNNMDKSGLVTNELWELLAKGRADIALVQEPYVVNGKVTGFGSARVVAVGSSPLAAIVIGRTDVVVTLLGHVSDSSLVAVEATAVTW